MKRAIVWSRLITYILIVIFLIFMTILLAQWLGLTGSHTSKTVCKVELFAQKVQAGVVPNLITADDCPPMYSKVEDAKIKSKESASRKYHTIVNLPEDDANSQLEMKKYVAEEMQKCYAKFLEGEDTTLDCWPCHYLYNFKLRQSDFIEFIINNPTIKESYLSYLNYTLPEGIDLTHVINFKDNSDSMLIVFFGGEHHSEPRNRIVLIDTNKVGAYCPSGLFT